MKKIKLVGILLILAITSCKKEESSQNNFIVNVDMELGKEIYYKVNIKQIIDDTTSTNYDRMIDTVVHLRQIAVKDTLINGMNLRAVETVNKKGDYRQINYYKINESGIYEIAYRRKGYLMQLMRFKFKSIQNIYPSESNDNFELIFLAFPRFAYPKPLKQNFRWSDYEKDTFKAYQVISTGQVQTESENYNCVYVKYQVEKANYFDLVEHSDTRYISSIGIVKGQSYFKSGYYSTINKKIGYEYFISSVETTKKSF